MLNRTAFRVGSWGLLSVAVLLFLLPLTIWAARPGHFSTPLRDVLSLYKALILPTALLSAASAAVAVLLGGATACLAFFSSLRVSRYLTMAMTVPLLIGFVARNYAWVGLLSLTGGEESRVPFVKEIASSLLYHPSGVVVVMGTVFVPFCYFVCLQGFSHVTLIMLQAAKTLGASNARIFWSIVFPISQGAFAIAFSMSTILALGYFITPALIGGGGVGFVGNGVIATLDLGQVPEASLLALLLLVTALIPTALTIVALMLLRRQKDRALTELLTRGSVPQKA